MNRWISAWLLLSLVVGAAVAQDASVTPISAIDDESGSEVNLESPAPAASADVASTEAAPAAAAASSSAQALAYVFGLEKGFPFVQIQFLQRGQRGVPRSQSRRRLQNAPTASAAVSRPALRVVLHSIAELNDTNGEPGWQEGETLLQNITLNLANLERDRINDNAAQLAAQPQFRLANGNSSGISVAWLAALDLQPQASNASSNASASSNATTGTSSGSALQSVLPTNSNLAGKFQRGDLWIGLWINNFTYSAPSSLACVQYALVGSQPFLQQNTTGGNATATDATLRTVAQVLGNHSVILTINGTAAPAATNETAETGNATSTASQPATGSPGALVYAWSDNYLANFTLPSGNQTATPAGAGKPVIASISPVTAAAEVAALGLDIRSSEHVALLRACFAERDTTLIWSSLLGFRGPQAESGF